MTIKLNGLDSLRKGLNKTVKVYSSNNVRTQVEVSERQKDGSMYRYTVNGRIIKEEELYSSFLNEANKKKIEYMCAYQGYRCVIRGENYYLLKDDKDGQVFVRSGRLWWLVCGKYVPLCSEVDMALYLGSYVDKLSQKSNNHIFV